MDNDDAFCKLRDWIDKYLDVTANQENTWEQSYERYRDFWELLPDIVWSLSRRRRVGGSFTSRVVLTSEVETSSVNFYKRVLLVVALSLIFSSNLLDFRLDLSQWM